MDRTTRGWVLLILLALWLPAHGASPGTAWHMDLPVHLGLFWVLGGWCWPARADGRINLVRWASMTVGVAALGESGQLYIPGRSFQFLDLWVNFAGITAGGLWYRHQFELLGPLHAHRRCLIVGLGVMAVGLVGNTSRHALVEGYLLHGPRLLRWGGVAAALGGIVWAAKARDRGWTVATLAGLIVLAGLRPPWTSPAPLLVGGLLVLVALEALRRTSAAGLLAWTFAAGVMLWGIAVGLPPDRYLRGAGGWILLAVLIPFQLRLWCEWLGLSGSLQPSP